jgi:hypothetical protein
MSDKNSSVFEGWTGPGRRDTLIEPLKAVDDALHITPGKRGLYEWWYFDAHLDSGHTLVVFFYAANPNPGLQGKIGVEIVLLNPDGKRIQKFFAYPQSKFNASKDKPEVTIGANTLRVTQQDNGLPVYEIYVNEEGLGCHLVYTAQVNGWKPGTGLSQFGSLGYFGWVVPFPRAAVTGTVTQAGRTMQSAGVGYHDHNWLNFPFQTIIDYWMWGRIYSQNYTVAYACIQCNQKVNHHMVRVLMLADGQEVVLSTGEFEFTQDDFVYSPQAKHHFPQKIALRAPGEMSATLELNRILEAQDMLQNFNPVLRFIAKHILRLKPGYFRLASDFELEVHRKGEISRETGTALHEIVLFQPVQQTSSSNSQEPG